MKIHHTKVQKEIREESYTIINFLTIQSIYYSQLKRDKYIFGY